MSRYVDHIVINVRSIRRSERFYTKVLGTPVFSDKYSLIYKIGHTQLFLISPHSTVRNNKFDKDRIGLNHLAFGVRSLGELNKYLKRLTDGRIRNSGIKIDKYGGKEFIWFDDPDKIRLEFYFRPAVK